MAKKPMVVLGIIRQQTFTTTPPVAPLRFTVTPPGQGIALNAVRTQGGGIAINSQTRNGPVDPIQDRSTMGGAKLR